MTRRLWVAVALVGSVACGIPLDAEPEAIQLEPGEPPVVERTQAEDLEAVPIYLVAQGAIEPVTRDLPRPRDVGSVLGSLLEGTTEPEERTGLRTSIPAETELLGVETRGSTAHLDLSRDFTAVGGEEELLAVAQIVLTVTELEGIDSILFELEGVPTDVPLPSGALADRPVRAEQYHSLLAR